MPNRSPACGAVGAGPRAMLNIVCAWLSNYSPKKRSVKAPGSPQLTSRHQRIQEERTRVQQGKQELQQQEAERQRHESVKQSVEEFCRTLEDRTLEDALVHLSFVTKQKILRLVVERIELFQETPNLERIKRFRPTS